MSSVREPRSDAESQAEPVRPLRRRWTARQRAAGLAGTVLTIALAFVAYWLATRPISLGSRGHTRVPQKLDSAQSRANVVALAHDTARHDSTADSTTRDTSVVGPTVAVPAVTNPADSASASVWAVELSIANTQAGAILEVQEDSRNLPAATFSPVLIQGSRWFRVIGGAFPTRAGADSLLLSLRKRGILKSDNGKVVQVPFAFVIEDKVTPAAVPGLLSAHAMHGLPVYALRKDDGTAWLLAGAFDSVDQASLFAESLRASGITPVLVYRKGRMF